MGSRRGTSADRLRTGDPAGSPQWATASASVRHPAAQSVGGVTAAILENAWHLSAHLSAAPLCGRTAAASLLITTNKGIRDWPEILAGDEVLATAILDRLLHKSHVLNIKGRSYRLRDLEDSAARGQ